MNVDIFNAMLQETLNSMEECICLITNTASVKNVFEDVSDYGSRIKDDVTNIFQQFNSDVQYQCSAIFDDFLNKCNSIVDNSMELFRKNEIVKSLSNDIFYNDESLAAAY